jgi:hypothetical protein
MLFVLLISFIAAAQDSNNTTLVNKSAINNSKNISTEGTMPNQPSAPFLDAANWAILLASILITLFGLGFLFWGLKEFEKTDANKRERNLLRILSGFILLALGVYLLGSWPMEQVASGNATPNLIPMWMLLLVVLLVFSALIWIGVCHPNTMEHGQMRRAIAGILVFSFVLVLIFALYSKQELPNNEIVMQYIQLVGIIIGFYFGSKVAGADSAIRSLLGKKEKVAIENPAFISGCLEFAIKNLSDKKFVVKSIRVDSKSMDLSGAKTDVDAGLWSKITAPKDNPKHAAGKFYNIEIETDIQPLFKKTYLATANGELLESPIAQMNVVETNATVAKNEDGT